MNRGRGEIQSSEAAPWLTSGRFAALLAGLLFVMFPGVVAGEKSFFHHDFTVFGYPLAHFHRESFWRGEIPFWNPLNNCGLPFLAQWNTITLYPGALVYLLLPLPWSLNLYVLLHLVLAGVGAHLLAHHWTENRFAAAIAGVAFALNGLSQFCLVWPNNVAALGWAPWVILLLQRAVDSGGRTTAVAGLVAAMQMLTGAPELIVLTWVVAAVLVSAQIVPQGQRLRKTLRVAAVALMALAIAAAQLLPFIELLASSQRDTSYADATYSMPATGWANLLIPLFRTYESRYGVYFQPGQHWTSSYYVGIAVVLLAIFAWRSGQKLRTALLTGLAASGLLFAMGDNGWLYPLVRKEFPALGFMNFPVKFIYLTVVSLPLLAALGAASMARMPQNQLRRSLLAVAIAIGAIVAGLVVFARLAPVPGLDWNVTLTSGLSRLFFLGVIAAGLHGAFTAGSQRLRSLLEVVTVLVIAADCMTLAPGQNPVIKPSILAPGLTQSLFAPPPRIGVGRAWIDPATYNKMAKSRLADPAAHITGLRLMAHLNCNLLDNIAKTDGFFSLYSRDMFLLKERMGESGPEASAGAFDFASILYCPEPDKELEWRKRPTALPFIVGGQTPVFAEGSAALELFFQRDFRPEKTVILPESARAMVRGTEATSVIISNAEFHNNRIEFTADAEAQTFVTIAQAFHPNWRTLVDDEPAPLLKANFAFQALELPPGRHSVRLVYRDRAFAAGALISGAGLLICAAIALHSRKRESNSNSERHAFK